MKHLIKGIDCIALDKRLSNNTVPSLISLRVRIEHQRDAFGIGTDRPRLSWILEIATQGWHQAAYEIEAYGADVRFSDSLKQTSQVACINLNF